MTKKQLAKKLGVTERTVNRYMADGMPYVKLRTGKNEYDYKAVRKWLKGDK